MLCLFLTHIPTKTSIARIVKSTVLTVAFNLAALRALQAAVAATRLYIAQSVTAQATGAIVNVQAGVSFAEWADPQAGVLALLNIACSSVATILVGWLTCVWGSFEGVCEVERIAFKTSFPCDRVRCV